MMRQAFRLVVCLSAVSLMLMLAWQRVEAQSHRNNYGFEPTQPGEFDRNFSSNPKLHSRNRSSRRNEEIEASIYGAIMNRLGAPYRSNGTDDRGYDCSGFVWSVLQEAGVDISRSSARTLWQTLPEATEEETIQFGTLVFFKGLNHVGIVRDGYSFYHASTSQGVVRSFYSGYWGERVIGFRRVPLTREWEVAERLR
jgi:cell wall-associated NlpC family hydrolase